MSGRPILARWRMFVAVIAAAVTVAAPVSAQSILRDAETESLLNDISRPLIVAAGLQPNNVKVVLIGDKEINAFVAGGQIVYVNAGLILAADNPNEVQGVVAHELGHVVGGHAVLNEGAKGPTSISLLSLLVGMAALAAGAGSAGMAAMMAGQQAAMGKYLAFSRAQESSADAFAVTTLNKAHITGKGMISFFGKLKQEEYRLSSSYADTDPFAQTHPLSGDRQVRLQADLQASPYWNTPTEPSLDARFQRIKAKLYGFIEDPPVVVRKYPESDQSVAAHYARAYAYHRGSYKEKAVAEVDALLAAAPDDPYFHEIKGQILLESGDPKAALVPLRAAVEESRGEPLIAALLGQALISTEDTANFEEARKVLKVAVARDEDNPMAWYNLGIVYDRDGDHARAAFATAVRYSMQDNPRMALGNAEMAMQGLPEGSSEYIRAQDIAMTARNAVETGKRKK